MLSINSMRATINVPNSKNCSQVINIGITSPRGKAKKKLTLPGVREATATVVVFLRVSPFREIPFFILRRVSGFVKKKRKNGEGTRATGGRPYKSGVFRETGWCRFCRVGVVGCPYKQGKQGLHGRYRIAPLFYTAERYPRASYGKLLSLV